MATIFGEQKFLKIGMATLEKYPVGQKFRPNRSIAHGFRDTGIFENWDGNSREIPCGSKISSKSLY